MPGLVCHRLTGNWGQRCHVGGWSVSVVSRGLQGTCRRPPSSTRLQRWWRSSDSPWGPCPSRLLVPPALVPGSARPTRRPTCWPPTAPRLPGRCCSAWAGRAPHMSPPSQGKDPSAGEGRVGRRSRSPQATSASLLAVCAGSCPCAIVTPAVQRALSRAVQAHDGRRGRGGGTVRPEAGQPLVTSRQLPEPRTRLGCQEGPRLVLADVVASRNRPVHTAPSLSAGCPELSSPSPVCEDLPGPRCHVTGPQRPSSRPCGPRADLCGHCPAPWASERPQSPSRPSRRASHLEAWAPACWPAEVPGPPAKAWAAQSRWRRGHVQPHYSEPSRRSRGCRK